MRNWIIASSAVVLAGLTVLFIVTAPSDEDLIRTALEESVQASRDGRPGGVLDHLSRSLTFNGIPVGSRADIAEFVRKSKPDIELGPVEPVIDGDVATVVTSVRVNVTLPGFSADQTVAQVQIRLARQTGVRWLLFPGTKWRISEVTVPDLASVPQLIQ
ncbi:MAG: hypothetical protein IIC73_02225 [Armatimonadetes bacterium]|nr:hypothetical protein [Armatimonadota bacterium]